MKMKLPLQYSITVSLSESMLVRVKRSLNVPSLFQQKLLQMGFVLQDKSGNVIQYIFMSVILLNEPDGICTMWCFTTLVNY